METAKGQCDEGTSNYNVMYYSLSSRLVMKSVNVSGSCQKGLCCIKTRENFSHYRSFIINKDLVSSGLLFFTSK